MKSFTRSATLSLVALRASRASAWFTLCLLATFIPVPRVSQAGMQIIIDSTLITDNGSGDLNPTVGTIDFSGIYGPTAYAVVGRLTDTPGVSGIAASTRVLRLTNFSAQAVLGSLVGTTMNISLQSNPFPATPFGTASDNISAEVGNASGLSVPASTDMLLGFFSIVDDGTVNQYPISTVFGTPVPIGNPFFAGGIGTTPYPVTGHSVPVPAMATPILLGNFAISLGAIDDRFIMPTSYDIGYQAVPEPSTLALIGASAIGFLWYGWRKRQAKA